MCIRDRNYIHFRDYLNANENVALQYEKLKEELESKYADDRVAYTNGKCASSLRAWHDTGSLYCIRIFKSRK